jgi:hypothetical protein
MWATVCGAVWCWLVEEWAVGGGVVCVVFGLLATEGEGVRGGGVE